MAKLKRQWVGIFLLMFFVSPMANATSIRLSCEWNSVASQNRANQNRPDSFYEIDSSFQIQFEGNEATILEDQFFTREYSPCWNGFFSRCIYRFQFDREAPFEIRFNDTEQIVLEQKWLYTAEIELQFEEPLHSKSTGDEVRLLISGSDGQSTSIDEEQFVCQVDQLEL